MPKKPHAKNNAVTRGESTAAAESAETAGEESMEAAIETFWTALLDWAVWVGREETNKTNNEGKMYIALLGYAWRRLATIGGLTKLQKMDRLEWEKSWSCSFSRRAFALAKIRGLLPDNAAALRARFGSRSSTKCRLEKLKQQIAAERANGFVAALDVWLRWTSNTAKTDCAEQESHYFMLLSCAWERWVEETGETAVLVMNQYIAEIDKPASSRAKALDYLLTAQVLEQTRGVLRAMKKRVEDGHRGVQ